MGNETVQTLVPAAVFAFGLLFFLIGFAMRHSSRKAASRYTMKVPAVVVAETRERDVTMDGHHMTYWRPTVQFIWTDGNIVTAESPLATNTPHTIGSQVTVLCSPSNPHAFALEDANKTVGTLSIVFLAIGVGIMLLAGILFLMLPVLLESVS